MEGKDSESETQDLIEHNPPDPTTTTTTTTTNHPLSLIFEPFQWLAMLCRELNSTFVLGVVIVYGISQGFSGSFFKVVSDYYWKDVQKVQPSALQMFIGFYYLPWIMKPLWGLLTDLFPVRRYRRRPYFLLSGVIGTIAVVALVTGGNLPVAVALVCMVGITASIAIADVTIDACIARNSIERPGLAADMQSLCGFVSSIGALIGYSTSGLFVHMLGAQGALGILILPPAMLVVLGFVIYELRSDRRSEKQKVWKKVSEAVGGMRKTIKCPQVWKPSLYMYLSLALSISTHEGQFYWYTDPEAGPAFSQEFVGMIHAVGAMASIIGVLIYHKVLKDHPFRRLLFFAQLLYGVSGILDLIFVLRWNLILGIPDYLFIVMEECASRIISRIRWMPMIVLSTKLCPLGIEGTFFALLMCIDSLGSLSSKLAGGVALHVFHVTRTDFRNLWLVVLIRSLLRLATLGLIFLVPSADQSGILLPPELLKPMDKVDGEEESMQLATLDAKEENEQEGMHLLPKAE